VDQLVSFRKSAVDVETLLTFNVKYGFSSKYSNVNMFRSVDDFI